MLNQLTERELAVLDGLSSGYQNKRIAYGLGVSRMTVHNYIASMCKKVGVNGRVELAVWYIQQGKVAST